MTEAADRFDSKRLGRIAYEVAKGHFPEDEILHRSVRSASLGWNPAAFHLRKHPVEQQASFFQDFFDRRSIQLPNGPRLAKFLATLNNPGQPLILQPDQIDLAQLVSEYFQNIGHSPMKIYIVQGLSEVVGEDMSEVVSLTLGATERRLYDTARVQKHAKTLTFVLNLTREVANSAIPIGSIESQRFMRRYAEICGGAIMVQALATDKQDPSFSIEPLIKLHERGYLIPGPVLTVAEQQPLWRRFLPVGPARQSTFMLYKPLRAK